MSEPQAASEPAPASVADVERALARGRLESAAKLAEQLIAAAPGDAQALVVRAKVAFVARDLGRAEQLLEQAQQRDIRIAELHHLLGNLHHDLGRPDRAVSAYRRAIRLRADFPEAHNDLGTAYFTKGWLREAEECFREAVRLKPDEPEAHQNLGETLRRLGRPAEARSTLQRALWLRIKRGLRRLLPGG